MAYLSSSDQAIKPLGWEWASQLPTHTTLTPSPTMAISGTQPPIKWETPILINSISAQLTPTRIPSSISPAIPPSSSRPYVTRDPISSAGPITPSSPNATSWSHKSMAIPTLSLSQEHKNIQSRINQKVRSTPPMLAGPMEGSQPIGMPGLALSPKAILDPIQLPTASLPLFTQLC